MSISFPEGPLLDRPQKCVVGPSPQFAIYGGAQEEKIRMNAFEMSASIYQPWLPMDVPKNESRRGREIGDTLHQQALFSECLRPLPIFWAPAAACPKPVQHQPIFLLKLKMPSQDEQWMCTS